MNEAIPGAPYQPSARNIAGGSTSGMPSTPLHGGAACARTWTPRPVTGSGRTKPGGRAAAYQVCMPARSLLQGGPHSEAVSAGSFECLRHRQLHKIGRLIARMGQLIDQGHELLIDSVVVRDQDLLPAFDQRQAADQQEGERAALRRVTQHQPLVARLDA